MATVLDGSAPFRSIFGYATVFAEDGRAMHKSWGNAIEFNEAADQMGVDVMRWLYCAHKPENNLPFGYTRADDVRRRFLIPLWNVYSFLVTYARLDNWTPPSANFDPATPEGSTPTSNNPLDRWLLARLNQVVARMIEALDNYDAFAATLVVEALIDDLTNWYVRRSRRRFWRSEQDSDKQAAYATLYHTLVKLAKLLAPFTPFVTEAIYQNLVRAVQPNAHLSIHHTDWPLADQAAINQALIAQVDLARRIASLGLSARTNAGLKVRQPLANVLVHVSTSHAELSADLVVTVADELNVKSFAFVADANQLVHYQILPNNKLLGPKFGSNFPKVRAALSALDPSQVAQAVAAGESITLVVNDETVSLNGDEVLVQTQPAPGLALASEKGVIVAVDTLVTPALVAEGQARELVRQIQQLRKEAGLEISDRIVTYLTATPAFDDLLTLFGDYLRAETLTVELVEYSPPGDFPHATFELGERSVTVALRKV
jgi:isoleucyl-tRNA synthetase